MTIKLLDLNFWNIFKLHMCTSTISLAERPGNYNNKLLKQCIYR